MTPSVALMKCTHTDSAELDCPLPRAQRASQSTVKKIWRIYKHRYSHTAPLGPTFSPKGGSKKGMKTVWKLPWIYWSTPLSRDLRRQIHYWPQLLKLLTVQCPGIYSRDIRFRPLCRLSEWQASQLSSLLLRSGVWKSTNVRWKVYWISRWCVQKARRG